MSGRLVRRVWKAYFERRMIILVSLRKILTVVIIGFQLLGLTGCNIINDGGVAVSKPASGISNKTKSDNLINLNNLHFILPAKWVKRENQGEVFFDDANKHTVGGISVLGYYGDYTFTLPNHSLILSTEDIASPLGKGTIFTLERSYPAAANNPHKWNEIHAIIPAKNNTAYDIWVNVNKKTLLNILKTCRY